MHGQKVSYKQTPKWNRHEGEIHGGSQCIEAEPVALFRALGLVKIRWKRHLDGRLQYTLDLSVVYGRAQWPEEVSRVEEPTMTELRQAL